MYKNSAEKIDPPIFASMAVLDRYHICCIVTILICELYDTMSHKSSDVSLMSYKSHVNKVILGHNDKP